jgi:multiple sugar transport system permease protein
LDTSLQRTDTQPKRSRRALSDRGVGNLFLLPTVLLLVGMNVFPLFWSLYLSFCKYTDTANNPAVWLGGANYSKLLGNPDIWNNFIITARFTGMAVGTQLLVGFGLALLLNRSFPAKGIITTLILLPMMLSPVVVGLFWNYMFHSSQGLLNWLLQTMHLQDPAQPVNWLSDPENSLWALVIVDTWMWSPFVMLISLAGLNAVPPHLYEAAEVDRASTWFKFRHITLPMVAPLVMIAVLFRTIDCFKIFDLVYVLTGGGPGDSTKTVSYSLYKEAFDSHNTGYACALAYMILLIIIGLANLFIKYLNKVRGEGVLDAETLQQALAERTRDIPMLGWLCAAPSRLLVLLLLGAFWRQIPIILSFTVGHLAVILGLLSIGVGSYLVTKLPEPLRKGLAYIAIAGTLVCYLLPIYWIAITSIKPSPQLFALPPKFVPNHVAQRAGEVPGPGYTFGATFQNYDKLLYKREGNESTGKIEGYSDFLGQLGNSLFIGSLSTFLSVALGTMAAYAFARFRIKGKGDLLFFILSTRMLPAIAVVIPIFLMYKALHLLDTRTGLVILYTVFNLSFSTYLLKGFFDDIPHEYDDAALLDGYSRMQAFWKISLPQALTGIATTAVFCFITAWNEFAFAQILSNDPITAPPSIVSSTGSGGTEWGQIAAGAVVFLIPAALFTFIMRKHLLRGVTFGAIKR